MNTALKDPVYATFRQKWDSKVAELTSGADADLTTYGTELSKYYVSYVMDKEPKEPTEHVPMSANPAVRGSMRGRHSSRGRGRGSARGGRGGRVARGGRQWHIDCSRYCERCKIYGHLKADCRNVLDNNNSNNSSSSSSMHSGDGKKSSASTDGKYLIRKGANAAVVLSGLKELSVGMKADHKYFMGATTVDLGMLMRTAKEMKVEDKDKDKEVWLLDVCASFNLTNSMEGMIDYKEGGEVLQTCGGPFGAVGMGRLPVMITLDNNRQWEMILDEVLYAPNQPYSLIRLQDLQAWFGSISGDADPTKLVFGKGNKKITLIEHKRAVEFIQ
jgi:hypothetical protein